MLDVAVRAARPEDLAELVRLLDAGRADQARARDGQLWLTHNARTDPIEPTLVDQLRSADHIVLLGTIDDVPCAAAVAEVRRDRHDSRFMMVHDLFVEPAAREVAVGELLLERLVAEARQRGCTGIQAVVLPGNREGKNFFERFGMKARLITVYRALHGDADE